MVVSPAVVDAVAVVVSLVPGMRQRDAAVRICTCVSLWQDGSASRPDLVDLDAVVVVAVAQKTMMLILGLLRLLLLSVLYVIVMADGHRHLCCVLYS